MAQPPVWYGGTKVLECCIAIGAINYLDLDGLIKHIKTIEFDTPPQLFIKGQDDEYFGEALTGNSFIEKLLIEFCHFMSVTKGYTLCEETNDSEQSQRYNPALTPIKDLINEYFRTRH